MRRVPIQLKMSDVMMLAACAVLVAFGLVCGSAYGDAQLDDDETDGPASFMVGSMGGSTQMAVASKSAVYNVGSGNCTCDDPDTEYTIVGASTNGSVVTIKGGSEQSPIRVTLDNVTIDQGSVKPSNSPITVESGHVVITLRGTNVLKAGYKRVTLQHDWGFAGLCVQKGATCVITSADGDGSTSGSLEAHGGHNKYGGAGIGTSYDDDTGSIYIRGGTIRAYGAPSAAGIGSGRDGECYTTCIQGGDVWAWGGEYAAGIGGGDAVGVSSGGTAHDLWVHGGTVHAYGGDNGGAGIGGSEGGSTDKITITGGNITAYGCGEHGSKGSAAGIGSGDGEECGAITIDQGSGGLTIDARGHGEGAGIGGANCKSRTIDITLRGGTIAATGGPEAAGIGSGDDESGAINIKGNGTINAQAGWKSAAIGAGDQGHSGPISINGNSSRLNINAYAPKPQNPGENFVSYAAIIGSGDGSASDISINNANINLNGTSTATIEGAGIGTGSSNDLSMEDAGIGNIAIRNTNVRFYGIHKLDGAGIGAGYGSNVKAIALDNVDYDGPTIGSSCSDRFGTDENSMNSISISNSNIKAYARGDHKCNHAGIGTGPYGTIGSITISNSNVDAKGVHGGAGIGSGGIYVNPGQAFHSITSNDGKCGNVAITGPGVVKAVGSDGGAGIGGGALASVYGDITISQGARVEAVGGDDSGAGIGGGKLCSCANISIDGATVTATGGLAAAGIGSGGVSDSTVISGAVQTTWNTTCGNVLISGESNVTATGGGGAAGIGLGQGAQMESGSGITISGGTVNAQGGVRGAGIGAGRESGLGRGAEARRIRIEGESKVTATGGAGAAGIGGGYEGGVEQCHIGLSVNDPRKAFVIARGGVGAAGIGAGASSRQSTSKGTLDGAHDAKSLSVSGGFVAAYGGNGSESSEEGRTGPGAGIGGGSYQGDLEGCLISGGVIVARAGAKASGAPSGHVDAEDIGHGGSREGGGDGSDSIYIQGGTVDGQVNERKPVLVSGGSVTHRFTPGNATSSNLEPKPVYQNAIAIDTSPLVPIEFEGRKFYNLGLTSTSADYFHCVDAFAIEAGENRAKAYLYLPAGEQNATAAFVKPADAELSYYGTTIVGHPDYTANTNVLKMGAPVAIVPKRRSADLVEGQPYLVRVGDLSGALGDDDSACYISAENAKYEGYRMADDTMNADVSHVPIYTNYVSSGRTYTDVTVIPGSAGETMKLTAKLNGASEATELYWGDGEMVFEKVIQTSPPYVEITNADALTKVYDGKPATNITYDTNGTVTQINCTGQWGTSYNKTVDSPVEPYMPTEVGYYEVTVWAQRDGQTVTDSASFKIIDPSEAKDLSVRIVEDPTKYYDGVAVGDPAVKVVQEDVDVTRRAAVEYSYAPGRSNPTEPGAYLVTATATLDGVKASDTRLFLIRKCPVNLIIDAPDKVFDGNPALVTATARTEDGEPVGEKQTIKLSYYKKQDDGSYGELDSAPEDIGSYRVVATSPGSEHYRAAEASATFSIFDKPTPFLYVDLPERFVYDAQAVDGPQVWDYSGEAKITYYDESGIVLDGAPKDAGNYSVEVSVSESAKYHAVSSGKIPFTILPRPAILGISAVGDQSTESAEVTVTIAGALADVVGKFIDVGVRYDEPDALSAQGTDDDVRLATQASATVQARIENVGGSLVATHGFDHVGAGEYEVTASYSGDPNYAVKEKAERFDKRMRGYRVSAEDKTVTFGAAPFAVQVEVRDSNGSVVADPALSYSQVSSEDLPMASEDAAVLGDGGIVSVQNAGVSAIRVDVAGDDTHEGNFDYAVITVEKAALPLTVTAKDKTADGKPAEVAYSVDDAAYPTPYSGDVALTYFLESTGARTQLDAAPTESGSYVVVATAEGDRNYNAAVVEASFKIQASSDPDDSDDPDGPDKPVNPVSPVDPVSPDSPGAPDDSDDPGNSVKPDNPDNPDNPNSPDSPDNPDNSGKPDNSDDSDKPNKPADSDNPDAPDNSDTSSKSDEKSAGSNDQGDRKGGTSASSVPRTGDNAVVWPLIVSAAVGFVALACSARRTRMKNQRTDAHRRSRTP